MQTAFATNTQAAPPPRSADTRAGKYLIFLLGNEEFGIPVLQAREILSLQEITPVPNTPDHVRGVINLRGKIIPIVDLRQKFHMEPCEAGETACIVVVHVQRQNESLQLGMIVDSVLEVTQLQSAEIEDAPDFGEKVATPWLMGLARKQNGVRILLCVDQVLSNGELDGLNTVSSSKKV